MDETYVRVKGEWMYLYRAVDKAGQTVDFFLSRNRDVNAAKAFLRKAMKGQRIPTKITLDAYAASHRAVSDLKQNGELSPRVLVRTSKYLNNLIEQDHRRIKQRLRPMLGLKSYRTAVVVIGGIELAEKIKKGNSNICASLRVAWNGDCAGYLSGSDRMSALAIMDLARALKPSYESHCLSALRFTRHSRMSRSREACSWAR